MGRDLIAEQAALEAAQGPTGDVVPGRNVSGISGAEQWRRKGRNRADQSGGEGTGRDDRPANLSSKNRRGRPRGTFRPHLTLTRALDMVTEAAEFLHLTVLDADAKVADRKHSSIGLAVMLDKWAMLSGRPTQIIQVGEAEARRPAVNRLAAKVVRLVQPQDDAKSA